jgi:hypothetical protein
MSLQNEVDIEKQAANIVKSLNIDLEKSMIGFGMQIDYLDGFMRINMQGGGSRTKYLLMYRFDTVGAGAKPYYSLMKLQEQVNMNLIMVTKDVLMREPNTPIEYFKTKFRVIKR